MAQVIIHIDKHEMQQRIRDAKDNGTDVQLLPQHAARMMRCFCEFEKIQDAVHEAKLTGFTSIPLLVSRLIGEHLALKQVTDAGVVPKMYWEHHTAELKAWRDWADLLADGSSDELKRVKIEDRLIMGDLWLAWAKRATGINVTRAMDAVNVQPNEVTLMRALQELLDERTALLAAGTQERLEGALEKEDSWFRWAQEALGLSDAYVAEQRLSVDDLQRMIRERL